MEKKRFTVMLSEETISQVKKARYSPAKKRVIIESLIKETFYQLESINYPKIITLSIRISEYDK